MKKILLTLIGTSFISGVLLSQNWSKSDIDFFVKECVIEAQSYFTKDGALKICNCSVEATMELYPYTKSPEELTEEEIDIVSWECIVQLLEKNDDILLKWDETTEANFIKQCKEDFIELPLFNAEENCPCILEAVMPRYTTPFELMGIDPGIYYEIMLWCAGE